MAVAKEYQDELEDIKKCIQDAHTYFEDNYKRYNTFRRFVFNSSIDDNERMILNSLQKPEIEFNIMEAYISRLRGEFSKQEPSVTVSSDDTIKVNPEVLSVIEGHLKHSFYEANREGCEYNVYSDTLSGGFSAIRVWTEYASPMSFQQVIKFGRVFDPLLVGFDPLARLSHKGDGAYCFEMFPMRKEDAEANGFNTKSIKFQRQIDGSNSLAGFNWSYTTNKGDKILLVCNFYKKKTVKKKICKLVTGEVVFYDDYKKFLKNWEEAGYIAQPPAIKGKPRWTDIVKICRYRLTESEVLEHEETDFSELPLVFVDGNSITLQDINNSRSMQMTRPYVYHMMGTQKLKNFAGQTLANELENMVQHKFKIAEESLPDEPSFLKAYSNVQIANTLVYKAFKDNDPNVPTPPPQEIARVPIPPEVSNTFMATDQVAQNILGSFDASLGINNNQLSGVAIVEGATQSNAAAMPYIVGLMQSLNQVAKIYVNLIPKYWTTPMTIPVIDKEGKKSFVDVNSPGNISLKYDPNPLHVKVEAGVNFAIQKNRALQQIIGMSQASPLFAEFINTDGLEVLLDNMDIRGIDILKQKVESFVEKKKIVQEQQMRLAQQQQLMNPAMMREKNAQMKMALDKEIAQAKHENQLIDFSLRNKESDVELIHTMASLKDKEEQREIQKERDHTAKLGQAVDMAIKAADMSHKHSKEFREHNHKIKGEKNETSN